MNITGKYNFLFRRLGHISAESSKDSYFINSLRILSRPSILLGCILFFVAATPFEMAQSGIAYTFKACSMLVIVTYAVFIRNARLGKLNFIAIIVMVDLVLVNLFGWTDRILVALLVLVAGTLLGQARGDEWNDEFRVIILFYLIVHSLGLLYAIVIFYGTGQVIDLHFLIFPNESRAEGIKLIGRLTGFHNEPGTYSQWMMAAIYLYALTSNQLYSKVTGFVSLTVLATISLWGFIAFGVIVVTFALEILLSLRSGHKIRRLIGFGFFITTIIILALISSGDILEQGYQFLERKGELKSQSGIDKMFALEFMRREFLNVIIFGSPFDPGFCPACISPQDAGVGITGSYYLGLLTFSWLIFTLVKKAHKLWGMAYIVPIFMLLFWKAHIYEPLLWVLIGYLMRGPINKRSQSVYVTALPFVKDVR